MRNPKVETHFQSSKPKRWGFRRFSPPNFLYINERRYILICSYRGFKGTKEVIQSFHMTMEPDSSAGPGGEPLSRVQARVPTLGVIDGLCYQNTTCQYLGIPYATIPGRFRRSIPAPEWPDNRFDGTSLGPYSPQPARDFYPIPVAARPWLDTPTTSESECLNLNITVPLRPETLEDKSHGGLPVMVFLHGGAFTYGAGSASFYDGLHLGKTSALEGIPTIIVTINYRLGVLGFLASHAIKAHNERFGEEGVGNYGLWDQVQALRWIQKHIRGFGGDPDRVTVFGQSAGGVSSNVHLLRGEPLFSSVVLQSGLLPLCGTMTIDEYNVVYKKTLRVLGISDSLSETKQLQCLLDTPEADLTASMVEVFMAPVVTLSPCKDGVLIPHPYPSYSSFDSFKLPAWCPRLMIGDAASETIIWNKTWRESLVTSMDVFSYASNIIGTSEAKTLLYDIYGLSNTLSQSEVFEFVEKFTTDAIYLSMNYDVMQACLKQEGGVSCYAYHFDEPSTYDTAWKGRAHHSFENVFIWSGLRDTLPPVQQAQSVRMAKMWLQFANGIEPWEAFNTKGRMLVFGAPALGEVSLRTARQDKARGYERWKKVREAGLTEEWGVLADNICMRRKDLVDLKIPPIAMEPLSKK